jgi:hypoxanthine phosphoribosyltransferase
VGVGDAFAVRRLKMPRAREQAKQRIRELGWAQFADVARELAERVGRSFHPDVVLGVIQGGVFLGAALSVPLGAEFRSVRVSKHTGRSFSERLSGLSGKTVLVVDDVTVSGRTLRSVCAAALKAGARDALTAALVVRPNGHHADLYAMETRDLVVFPWDYQLHGRAAGSDDPGDAGV